MNVKRCFWFRTAISLLLFAFSAPVLAQESEGVADSEIDCEQAIATVDIRNCAGLRYEKLDAALNELYREMAAYHERENDQEGLALLRQAQRDWIKFRDSFCYYQYPLSLEGTMWPILRIGCFISLTEQQTQRLRFVWEDARLGDD